jgi:hypothetical protein
MEYNRNIIKVLHIYYNDIEYLSIELSRDIEYYFDIEQNKIIHPILPIILYYNYKFKNDYYEKQYKLLVRNEIKKQNKNWSDIIKIEEIYERE